VLTIVTSTLVLTAIIAATYTTLREARDAADGSCLASLHADLQGKRLLQNNEPSQWREWSEAEVASALSRADPRDCSGDWWREDVAIRTRRGPDGRPESQIWRKSRPEVSSPWGALR